MGQQQRTICKARDMVSIPGGTSPGEGNGNLLQYSCLENPMDRGAWRVTVHRVTQSRRQLSMHTLTRTYSEWNCSPKRCVKFLTWRTSEFGYRILFGYRVIEVQLLIWSHTEVRWTVNPVWVMSLQEWRNLDTDVEGRWPWEDSRDRKDAYKTRNAWDHEQLEKTRKEPPLELHREHGSANTLTSDL